MGSMTGLRWAGSVFMFRLRWAEQRHAETGIHEKSAILFIKVARENECSVHLAGFTAWRQDPSAAMVIPERTHGSLQPGKHHHRSCLLHLHESENSSRKIAHLAVSALPFYTLCVSAGV